MVTKKTYYYVAGNTSKGFINYITSNIKDVQKIIVLSHPSANIKTRIFKSLIECLDASDNIEIMKSTIGREHIDGVAVRNQSKSVAILSDHIAEPVKDKAMWIDLTNMIPSDNDENVRYETMQINHYMEQAYRCFAQGLKTHDQLESIYIKEMDFKRADKIIDSFIDQLLSDWEKKDPQHYSTIKRFFGTTTSEGPIHVIEEIIKHINNRIFIKGRAGTGKSVFMKRVAKACENHGYSMIMYHCSFDPDSIDMVFVPELDFCIFDSTDPHEMFPDRETDVVIDLYEKTVTEGTDEKYEKEITSVTQTYKGFVKQGVGQIKNAERHRKNLESYYPFITINSFEKIIEHVLKQI